MDLKREWYRSEFLQQEMLQEHRLLEEELTFYNSVANGNIDYVKENCKKNTFTNSDGMGKLSDNPLQNIRYHFVITAAMVTRYCVSKGMEQKKAYVLSDFFIRKMDKCSSISEIANLHNAMCIDFCNHMLKLRNSQILSKPIVLCMDYIYSHIHCRITVKELAKYINLSEGYLSKLFSKEMGLSISEYILNVKIDQSKNLLQYSDYSIVDISNYLAFSSQSHFIQVFQKKVGTTPHKFRTKYFRSTWELSLP
ncbi:MAG TPA: helix-turn-helix domain-containing protein [Clostridiales bacterium]|nr:helix-turn-helix domain-containing protein [Clostridiales bacterium]